MERLKIDLFVEHLEERIAPGLLGDSDQGNNGFGNGGFDGVPGSSGDNNSPNAIDKELDIVR